jgi:YidC/Oxa1 family membrane protein insertase
MDRNAIMGIIAMIAFIFVWYLVFPPEQNQPQPSQKQQSEQKKIVPSDAVLQNPSFQRDTSRAVKDTLSTIEKNQQIYGLLAPFYQGQSRKIKVKTDQFSLEIDTKGGLIKPVLLNKYKTYDKQALPVITDQPINQRSFQFRYRSTDQQVRQAETKDFYFQMPEERSEIVVSGDQQKVISLRAYVSKDTFLEKRYTFTGNKFDVKCDLILHNMGQIVTDNFVFFRDELKIPVTEKSREKMLPEVNLTYRPDGADEDVERLEVSESDSIHERIELPIKWYAFRNQFFSSVVIAENRPFMMGGNLYAIPINNPNEVKRFRSELAMEYKHGTTDSLKMTYYYGPNDVEVLRSYQEGMSKLVQLGWGPLRYISLGIQFIFKFLEQFFSNYGVIIFFLVVIVKIVLSPLTYRSYMSQAKMQIVNKMPELKELEEKFKDDPQKLQQKKMEFYTSIGVNPLGGCVPALLQFPILIAAFFFFPQSIELRQQALFWAEDLSTYDSILDFGFNIPFYGDHISLFALLSTAVTLLYTHLQMQNSTASVPASMKYIQYLMPVFFLGILNNYSAGLSLYNFISTLITIAQTYVLKSTINEDKLHQKILDAKNKVKMNPKKSKIQQFVEEQQRKQQELNKIRSQARNKKHK